MHAPLPVPSFRFLTRIEVAVEEVLDVGLTDAGHRRIATIKGGAVRGEGLCGEVVRGGTDRQVELPDGSIAVEAQYVVRDDGGALVSVRAVGMRTGAEDVLRDLAAGEEVDPASYYYRTAITFETASPAHRWLTRALAVGVVARRPESVIIDVYTVT